jgi:hypothetical protein
MGDGATFTVDANAAPANEGRVGAAGYDGSARNSQSNQERGFQGTPRFESVVVELKRIKEEQVDKNREWYESHARPPMIMFRLVGVLIILVSVTIPFLTSLPGPPPWQPVLLSGAALLLAALTGLNAFFQWQDEWRGFRETQFVLEHLLSKWELAILEAQYRSLSDEALAIETATDATRMLLERSREAIATETTGYFAGLQSARADQSTERTRTS